MGGAEVRIVEHCSTRRCASPARLALLPERDHTQERAHAVGWLLQSVSAELLRRPKSKAAAAIVGRPHFASMNEGPLSRPCFGGTERACERWSPAGMDAGGAPAGRGGAKLRGAGVSGMVWSGAHVSIASSTFEDLVLSGLAPVAHVNNGLSCSQAKNGACRSEGLERLVAGEHVPDRLGELASELDLGDLCAALATQPALGALVALGDQRVRGGGDRSFHQPPAQVSGTVLGQRPATVDLAGL